MDREFNADGNNSQNMEENLQNSQAALEKPKSTQQQQLKRMFRQFEEMKKKNVDKDLEIEILKQKNDILEEENAILKGENATLKENNNKLRNEDRALKDRNSHNRGRNELVNSPMPIHTPAVRCNNSIDPVKKKRRTLDFEKEFIDDKECCDLAAMMKNNKMQNLNPKLEVVNGLIVEYPAIGNQKKEWCTVRAKFPVQFMNKNGKRRYIASYYEVKIRKLKYPDCTDELSIGYCGLHFPSKGRWIGKDKNTIGIQHIGAICIGEAIGYENQCARPFKEGNIIGSGLQCSPTNDSVEYFCTLNGELLVTYELPEPKKFTDPNQPIFPAISLQYPSDAVSINFGQNKWQFDPTKLV